MSKSGEARAVVAFSFGLRDMSAEPNPCNRRLARAVERIIRDESSEFLIISQWEVARKLTSSGIHVDKVITTSSERGYLDSDQVWLQAFSYLQEKQVTTVIPVAQPFLQMHKVKNLIRKSGITIQRERIGWIGFDGSTANTQWWTKGPTRLLVYALLQALERQTPPDRRAAP